MNKIGLFTGSFKHAWNMNLCSKTLSVSPPPPPTPKSLRSKDLMVSHFVALSLPEGAYLP